MSVFDINIFNLLDKWSRFPYYQVERRADIFFAYFLPNILNSIKNPNDKFNMDLCNRKRHDYIIPEFPLWIGYQYEKGKIIPPLPINAEHIGDDVNDKDITRHAKKVDYAVIDTSKEQDKKVFLIELKTTNESIEDSQVEILAALDNEDENYKKTWRILLADALYISKNHTKGKELRKQLLTHIGADYDLLDEPGKRKKIKEWHKAINCFNQDILSNWRIIPVFIIPAEKGKNTKTLNEYKSKNKITVMDFKHIFHTIKEFCPKCKNRTEESFPLKEKNIEVECFCKLLENIYIEENKQL